MKRPWEYREVFVRTGHTAHGGAAERAERASELNALGADGWELVAVQRHQETGIIRSVQHHDGTELIEYGGVAGLLYVFKRPVGSTWTLEATTLEGTRTFRGVTMDPPHE